MAQIGRNCERGERLRLLVRQRPGVLVVAALFAGLVLGAAVFGVAQAAESGGIEIERVESEELKTGAGGIGASSLDATGYADAGESGRNEVDADVDSEVVVDVSGAVVSPGVISLPEGSRVQDAIERAGGLSDDADPAVVNRAAKLIDGQQVYIPRVGELQAPSGLGAASGAETAASGGGALVNINTATIDELDTLSGVGPSTAQAIVEDREANGPFATIEDLMRVSGIGEKKFENLKSAICV